MTLMVKQKSTDPSQLIIEYGQVQKDIVDISNKLASLLSSNSRFCSKRQSALEKSGRELEAKLIHLKSSIEQQGVELGLYGSDSKVECQRAKACSSADVLVQLC